MNGKVIALCALALMLGLVVYAWIDGGEEPVREIVAPVPILQDKADG